MAEASAVGRAGPGLWRGYRHELYKTVRQPFYWLLVLLPLALTLLVCAALLVLKLLAPPQAKPTEFNPFSDYDLGAGLFAAVGDGLLNGPANFYVLLVVLGCALAVANEYRWGTIKMMALRQPSRAGLVLAKCLLAATLVGAVALAFVISWWLLTFVQKIYYDLPLTIDATDADAIGKSLHFFAIIRLQTVISALFAIALTFRFRSIIGGIIGYLVYSTLDTQVSHLGAAAATALRLPVYDGPDWLRPFLGLLVAINPYLLTSNIDRLIMRPTVLGFGDGSTIQPNPLVLWNTPETWAWFMVALYTVGFTLLAVWVFARRDITD